MRLKSVNYLAIAVATAMLLVLGFSRIAQVSSPSIAKTLENSSPKTEVIQDNLLTENNSNILYFGYVIYSRLAIRNESGLLRGYCSKLISYLKNDSFNIQEVEIKIDERFQGYKGNKKLAGECGLSTITQARINKLKKINGQFSQPFALTGAKLLINNAYLESFYRKISLEGEKIGVLEATTTYDIVKNIFPSSEIQIFSDKGELLTALEEGEIVAYAADEVTLIGILQTKNLKNSNNYSIVPKFKPLSYEEVGIVVYNNDKLLTSINNWIASKDGKDASSEIEKAVVNDNWNGKILFALLERSNSITIFLICVLIILFPLLLITHPFSLFCLTKIIPERIARMILNKIQDSRNNNQLLKAIFNQIFYTTVYLALGKQKIQNNDNSDNMNQQNTYNQSGNFGIGNMSGGEIQESAITGNINENQVQNLAEAAQQIQALLDELAKNYPTDTTAQKMQVATQVIERIESDPKLKNQVVNALKEGGFKALETHPIGAFVVGAIKGWQDKPEFD